MQGDFLGDLWIFWVVSGGGLMWIFLVVSGDFMGFKPARANSTGNFTGVSTTQNLKSWGIQDDFFSLEFTRAKTSRAVPSQNLGRISHPENESTTGISSFASVAGC